VTRRTALRILQVLGLVVLLYVVVLFIIGWAIEGKVERGLTDRMGKSLDAKVTVKSTSVSLLRGKVEFRGVSIEREGTGYVKIVIDKIDADIPSLGMAMFDGTPDLVTLEDVDIQLSPLAFRKRKPAKPMRMGGLEVKNVRIRLIPTPLMPSLGKSQAVIDYARTGPMEMRSGLSFLFHLRRLQAHADLPHDVHLGVRYEDEYLSLKGPIFDEKPLKVHFPLPKPDPDALETAQAVALGKSLGKVLIASGGAELIRRLKGKAEKKLGIKKLKDTVPDPKDRANPNGAADAGAAPDPGAKPK
jgi:hypothetical protein